MSAAINAPTQLEKYELLEELGHGGMATVYRARDRRLGREVAIKILHRHLRDEIEVKERFHREAKAVAKLRHPGIVEVYDVSEPDDAERYLVVELVRGITLRQLLREHAPLPPELGLAIGIAVAEALAHAHGQGVVHRDVKPENVLLELPSHLRAQGNGDAPSGLGNQSTAGTRPVLVKITDFGIAKVLDVQGVTSTGEVLGSPAHMAPEQIEGQSVGPQADIFSLGVMIYECVVGNLPFQGKNPAQVLRSVLDGQFVSTARARPEVGALIGQVIDRALARDPKLRFEDVTEFAGAMQAEIDRVEIRQPLAQLSQYLQDPKQFEAQYRERLVTTLVTRAQHARRDGAIVLSSALYNRALALRPDDPSILADVARLTRSERRKATFIRGAVLLAALGVALGAYRWALNAKGRATRASTRTATTSPPNLETSIAKPIRTPELAPAASIVAGPGPERHASHPPLASAHPANGNNRGAPRPVVTAQTGTRVVQVVLSGAAGSRLLIDGIERDWFGVKHELDYGVHRFQVVAPNDQCCVVPEPRMVKIGPGEGEIRVGLKVDFRDAQLQLSAADGTTLSCGELFPGILAAPGRRSVRVSKPETHGTCTLFPSAESGKLPRTIDVVLRPGGTFTVSGT